MTVKTIPTKMDQILKKAQISLLGIYRTQQAQLAPILINFVTLAGSH